MPAPRVRCVRSVEFCENGNPNDARVPGKCTPLPADGKPCAASGVCAPTYVCVIENQNTLCRQIHNNGGSCAMDAACRSGNCAMSVCAPPAVCN